ncbi:MAG: hypothetical protein B5M48_01680 [Candidatus Omnitrophica bacterium 4484_213]|nr:MAG: hypothetical protein B5M48_01680 [Candidatus Omnitrophica bacterium 4484_213]
MLEWSKAEDTVAKKGFSIIEVSVAIVILIFIVGGMLTIFVQGSRETGVSRQRTAAYNLATQIMERHFVFPPSNHNGSENINGVQYDWHLDVEDAPVYPAELKQLTVGIQWGSENYTLTTFKADY